MKNCKKGLCHIWLGGELYLQATHLWAIDHWATLVGVRLGWVELSKFWKPQQSFGRRPFESSTSQQPNSVGLKERTWVKSFFFIFWQPRTMPSDSRCAGRAAVTKGVWGQNCTFEEMAFGQTQSQALLLLLGRGIHCENFMTPLLLCSSYENFKQLFFCELSL